MANNINFIYRERHMNVIKEYPDIFGLNKDGSFNDDTYHKAISMFVKSMTSFFEQHNVIDIDEQLNYYADDNYLRTFAESTSKVFNKYHTSMRVVSLN